MAISKTVAVVQKSQNSKIALKGKTVSATYISQKTCPSSCPLKGNGCYAERGYTNVTLMRLEAITKELNLTARDLAIDEARGIDKLKAEGQDLRMHVVGDCKTTFSALTVSAAAMRFKKRGGGQPWTYTHAWRTVPRFAWRGVSVIASLHDASEGLKALQRGYAPAVVVDDFPQKSFFDKDGIRWINCKEQENGTPCTECRLCFKDDVLKKNKMGIAFKKH
jgi:hypothetical protein